MPAKSEAQRRLMDMALAVKRGDLKRKPVGMSNTRWKQLKKTASTMSTLQLEDFAADNGRKLPGHVKRKRG